MCSYRLGKEKLMTAVRKRDRKGRKKTPKRHRKGDSKGKGNEGEWK